MSVCTLDVSVCIEEPLDFLERVCGSLNMDDVVEKRLEVSLKSFDPEAVLLPVARRNRLVIAEVAEDLERTEGDRVGLTWKLDNGFGDTIGAAQVVRIHVEDLHQYYLTSTVTRRFPRTPCNGYNRCFGGYSGIT